MRRLVIVWLCTLAAVAWAGPEDEEDPDEPDDAPAPAVFDPTQTRARGFDHLAHDGKVTVTGQPSIDCAACHPLDKKAAPRGTPTHDTCYGACHAGAPAKAKPAKKTGKLPAVAIDEVAARMCEVCHAPADLAGLAAGTASKMPAYVGGFGEPDYGIQISHQGHDARTGCETCHATSRPTKKPAKPHQRCTACHQAADAAVPMTACASCHTLAGEAHPELDHGPLEVAFTHDGHAGKATADCKACHAAVAAATTTDLGAIGHADCRSAGCHDGTGPAFATTESCTRCHAEAPAVTYPLDRPRFRFSHARHEPRIGDVACSTCHAIDARGEAPPPPHRACADGACHQKDFEIRAPQTCGACHVSIEPWRALEADALPRVETEFGAVMPHARHASLDSGGPACTDCHSLATSRRQKRPPRGHRSCTGDGCHAESSGPTPLLTACTSCHRPGLVSEHVHDRQNADWSVRARFDHALHPGDCTTCHDQVGFTDALPAPPAKASCAPCHDGTTAFKMTGHGCVRCHGSE